MSGRRIAGLLALTLLGGCAAEKEAEQRAVQIIVVAKDKRTLQATLGAEEGIAFFKPFQSSAIEGKCGAMLWIPKISFIQAAALLAPEPKPVPAGLFEPAQLTKDSQNSVQAALGQRPTFAELDAFATKRLAAYKLPEALGDAAGDGFGVPMDAIRGLGGRGGVIFYRDAKAQPDEALKTTPKEGDLRLPTVPVPYADAGTFQKHLHEIFCRMPMQEGAVVPTAILVGAAGPLTMGTAPLVPPLPASIPAASAAQQGATSMAALPPSAPPSANAQRSFDRGLLLVQQGNLELAVKEFTSALGEQPTFAAALSNRGVAQMKLKNYGRALDDIRKAIELEPANPIWHYNLASYHSVRQEGDRGLDALDQALKLGFAKTDNTQIDALKMDAKGDPDLAFLRKRRAEYCAVLERHNKFLCK